ncbi:CU044_5270 family protein [Nonomuraea guangzhouensis]|uniref:CU044_5270 family protein n=1 Tax=Nonomuraea guangzhouensis TaxID=1291555 RepID=A0ABW4GWC5_9ACTN|nr:CU044_5270 family protein [Nonomuraea guangzhouensis]
MNPIDELRAARPAHLGDTPVDERTRAAELSYAMSRPRSARRKRRAVRPVWGFSLVGAAAAATAVAVVVSGTGGTTPRAPDVAAPTTVTSSTPKVKLSARDILLTAAAKAARQPAGKGAYWHTVSMRRTLFAVDGADYQVMDRQREEGWTPNATGGDQWGSIKPLGARPVTAADEEAWKQAGSPAEIPVKVPGKSRRMTLTASPRKAFGGHSPLVDGDKVFWLGRNVTMKDLRGLPSDPAKLKAWLLRSYEGHSPGSSSDPMTAEPWLFTVSVGLITDMPVTPQVRGAAFRMLADLDIVDVIENVTDAEGRQGTAVAVKEHTMYSGIVETRLIFDQATGQGLANESVLVKPEGVQSSFEPGTVWNSQAVLEAGWTDRKPSS